MEHATLFQRVEGGYGTPMASIPGTPEEVTPGWMTEVLREAGSIQGRVEGLDMERIGEGVGILSTILRCRIRYERNGNGPRSVVVKLGPKGESYQEVVQDMRLFEREVRFYREIAPLAPLRTPTLFFGDYDGHGGALVLEDLGHLEARNQVHGLKNREAIAAARMIARLQARLWNSAALDAFDWMPLHDYRITTGYAESWEGFTQVYGLRVGVEAIELGTRLRDSLDWILHEITTRPVTVIHGDYRADNLFFGPVGSEDQVVAIDWAFCTRALGALDPTRLLGGSEPPAERNRHQLEIFAAWHETLRHGGVEDYPLEEALYDFRLGALLNLCIPVHLLSVWGADPDGRQGQLLDVFATRLFASALELDAGAILPR